MRRQKPGRDGGVITGQYDYAPFGKVMWKNGLEKRLSFIDKEKDEESGDHNFGVRQYDDVSGRFMAIDPLWEKYRSLSPYQYSRNNPLIRIDPTGMADSAKSPQGVKSVETTKTSHVVTRNNGVTETTKIQGNLGLKVDIIVAEIDAGSMTTDGEYTRGVTVGPVGIGQELSPPKITYDGVTPIKEQTLSTKGYVGVGNIIKLGGGEDMTIRQNLITGIKDTNIQTFNFLSIGISAGLVFGGEISTETKVQTNLSDLPDVVPYTATVSVLNQVDYTKLRITDSK